MIGTLLAYTDAGDVVAALDYRVMYDDDDVPTGLVDFEAHEAAGGEATDIWTVDNGHGDPVKGSKAWPEWLGAAVHDFRVELEGPAGSKKIAALVHKKSGHRRERAAIEAAIAAVPEKNGVRDLRHVVGGLGRPLALDADGKNRPKRDRSKEQRLPVTGGPEKKVVPEGVEIPVHDNGRREKPALPGPPIPVAQPKPVPGPKVPDVKHSLVNPLPFRPGV